MRPKRCVSTLDARTTISLTLLTSGDSKNSLWPRAWKIATGREDGRFNNPRELCGLKLLEGDTSFGYKEGGVEFVMCGHGKNLRIILETSFLLRQLGFKTSEVGPWVVTLMVFIK